MSRFLASARSRQKGRSLAVERLEDRLPLSVGVAGDGCPAIDYSVDAAWYTGYTAGVSLANDEATVMNGWTVEFDLPARITSLWNARIVSADGTHYRVEHASWNREIAPGAFAAFGFVAAGSATDAPTNWTFNGIPVGEPGGTPLPVASIADLSVTEGDSGTLEVRMPVRLSGPAEGPVTVDYRTVDGTARAGSDYQAVEGVLVFAPGEVETSLVIPAFGDTLPERAEYFQVELTGASGATIGEGEAVVQIVDNDPVPSDGAVRFEVTADWATGFTGQITIRNEGPVPLDNWVLDFDFAGNIPSGSIWNASIASHVGNHYVIHPASWNGSIAAGGSVSFGFIGTRPNESVVPTNFLLNGTPADGGGTTPVVPTVSIADARATEGDAATATAAFRVYLSQAAAEPVTVEFATSDGTAQAGTDYHAASGTVAFAAGEVEKTVAVEVVGDTLDESDETFYVQLSAAVGAELADAQAVATIVDDDLPEGGGSGDHRVIAYFAEWGIYDRNYTVADIPADDLTHVIYAFADISPAGEVTFFDEWAATGATFPGDTWDQPLKGNFHQLQLLKEQHPHLRTTIAVGGWTLSGRFSDVALTDASRERFAESAVEFVVTYGFDGIDLDWEYPVAGGLASNAYRPEDSQNYTLLVAELREQFDLQGLVDGKRYEISVASPAGFDKIANFQLAAMSQYVDWFNVMAYDYHGTWENTTNHQAPLYGSPDDPSYWASRYNVDWTIGAYLDAGVAANQLLLGIPLYSRGWRGVGPADGLYQSAAGAAPGTWEPGMFDYWDVRERLRERPDQYVRYWDAAAGVPYVYSPLDGGTFLTYEDRESVALKIDYVMEHELGGAYFWELSGDVRDRESPDCLVALAADRLLAAR